MAVQHEKWKYSVLYFPLTGLANVSYPDAFLVLFPVEPKFSTIILNSALCQALLIDWSSHWKWSLLLPCSVLGEWLRKSDLEILKILPDLWNDLSFHYRMMSESNLNIEEKKGKERNITCQFIGLIKCVS